MNNKKRSGITKKKLSRADEECLKVMCLRNKEKKSAKICHRTGEKHLAFQLFSLLFEVSSEMISMEGWLSRSKGNRLRYDRLHKNWTENKISVIGILMKNT